jgi:hypothetical protein
MRYFPHIIKTSWFSYCVNLIPNRSLTYETHILSKYRRQTKEGAHPPLSYAKETGMKGILRSEWKALLAGRHLPPNKTKYLLHSSFLNSKNVQSRNFFV